MDLDIFSLFQFVAVSLLYNLYVSMFETPDMGPGIFTFLCFSLFRNVSKQLKAGGLRNFLPVSLCFSSFTI